MIGHFSRLKRVGLFSDIPEADLSLLLQRIPLTEKKYIKGQSILHQGAEYTRLYILLYGTCYGEITDITGKTIKVEDFHAPTMLAPAVLFASQNTMPGSVVAKRECEVMIIDKSSILTLCSLDTRILKNLLNLISNKFVFISGKLAFFSFKTIKEKLANYLLGLPEQTGGQRIMAHSMEELAEFFGVTRPSLSRVVAELVQQGIIERRGKKVILKDKTRLVK
jgi:CRP/FNR family transcriptional regulator, dissimilatory nitrate respiration regulator